MEHRVKRRRLNSTEPKLQLSALEKLPVEILEQIFLDSRNAVLPRVSKTLRHQLSSDFVKKAMITRCFRSRGLNQDESVYHELEPISRVCSNLPTSGQLVDELCYPTAFRELCALLEEDWVTMTLVKGAVADWMWNAAVRELRKFIQEFGFSESDFQEAIPLLRQRLDKCTTNMTLKEIQFFRLMEVGPAGPQPRTSQSVAPGDRFVTCRSGPEIAAKCPFTFIWPTTGEKFMRIAFLENGFDCKTPLGYVSAKTIKRDSTGLWFQHSWSEQNFVTWRSDWGLLPARLLRGPWTQERGDLLKFLLDQCDNEDDSLQRGLSAKQKAAAEEGVAEAIRSNSQIAAFTLLGKCSPQCAMLCRRVITENAFAAEHIIPGLGEYGWMRLSWSQDVLASMNIQLTTEHLRLLIDGFDARPQVSLQVLGHLLHPSTKIPELPANFLAKCQKIVESEVRWQSACASVTGKVIQGLYNELYNELLKRLNTSGRPKVGFTCPEHARTTGASVSMYVLHANVHSCHQGPANVSWQYGANGPW